MVAHRELQLVGGDVGSRDQRAGRARRSHLFRHARECRPGRSPGFRRLTRKTMQERSEEEILSRLLELENDGQAERRAQLTEERYLTLLHDPDTGRSSILRHGSDHTEGAEIPRNTEFYEYAAADTAQRAFEQLLDESRRAGELVEDDSSEGVGDFESSGAEIRDLYSASDEDELTQDSVISEEEQPRTALSAISQPSPSPEPAA